MLKTGYPTRELYLCSEILIACDDIIKNDSKFCLMCMRTEKVRKLAPSKSLHVLLGHLDKQEMWALQGTPLERLLLCWVCEARAAGALRTVQAVRAAIRAQRLLAHCRRFPNDVETLDDILKGKAGASPLRALAQCCEAGLRAARRASTLVSSATQLLTSERHNEPAPAPVSSPAAKPQVMYSQMGMTLASIQQTAQSQMGVTPPANQRTAQAQAGATHAPHQRTAQAQMGVSPSPNHRTAQLQMSITPSANQTRWKSWTYTGPIEEPSAPQMPHLRVIPSSSVPPGQEDPSAVLMGNKSTQKPGSAPSTSPKGPVRTDSAQPGGVDSQMANEVMEAAPQMAGGNGSWDQLSSAVASLQPQSMVPEPMLEIVGVKEEQIAEMETYLIEDDEDCTLIEDSIKVEQTVVAPPADVTHYMLPNVKGQPMLAVRGQGDSFALHQVVTGSDGYMYVPTVAARIKDNQLEYLQGQPTLVLAGDPLATDVAGTVLIPADAGACPDAVPIWGMTASAADAHETSSGTIQETAVAFQVLPPESRAKKRTRSEAMSAALPQEPGVPALAPFARRKAGAIDWEDKIPDNVIAYCDS